MTEPTPDRLERAADALVAALCERPSDTGLLRRLGDVYACMGRDEDAALCYRCYVPPSVNERHLGARELAVRLVASSDAAGADYRLAHAPETKELIAPPQHAVEGVRVPRFPASRTETSAAFSVTLPKGSVWFDRLNLVVTDARDDLVVEHSRGNRYLGYRAMRRAEPTHLPGRACFLDARSTQVYYHFMIDMLPKLGLLADCGIALDGIDHFIVPDKAPWQREIMTRYGIPEDRMIPSGPQSHYRADELVVPALNNDLGLENFDGMGLALQPWIPEFHRRSVLTRRRPAPSRRTFLARDGADGRGIVQSEALERAMVGLGFDVVRPERLDLAEQAALMHESAIVVGPHGGAFTNCVFCGPSTTLVEIFRTNFYNGAFRALADTVGMGYEQYFVDEGVCADAVARSRDRDALRAGAISLDVEHFASTIETVLAARR